ncbi:hypothetical protein JOC78_002776 [Bacillus ectoiniformans]|uniref:hypothetical protein n=1 Tax=Bacillus ectoiniformans TaxID=1494429 RepID=UPI0019570745|nr:hypothetical protein [Bacillus ectoiniformans]MBM7649792.1 hypothetical protein [Bacillus ectoiniformans]
MKKWMFSALAYLALVIAGYFSYEVLFGEEKNEEVHGEGHTSSEIVYEDETKDHDDHKTESTDSHSEEAHGHGEKTSKETEVNVTVKEDNGQLILTLKDPAGQPLTDLEINHEKLLHLIVVDEHLDQYYHLHPEETAPGQFETASTLKEGTYKAFVDIKPKNLDYEVQPLAFSVGTPAADEHSHGSLKADQLLEKTVDGNMVTLETSPLVKNEPVTLTFDVHGAELEPFLGAMGHVVILDEEANEYLHVHPADEKRPVFETEFSQPGIYKIWAEFQKNGKVTVYPFVVEVK